jgi:hypothetical protein
MDLQAAVTAMQAARHRVERPGRKAKPQGVVSGGAGGWDTKVVFQPVRREQPEG